MIDMFHTNLFELGKAEPLDIGVYLATIKPEPTRTPLSYKILGRKAKELTKKLRAPVISHEGRIKVLGALVPDEELETIITEDVGSFTVTLQFEEERKTTIENFEEYKLFFDRIIDVALTILSQNYYKFHPDAPYIIKDDPTFDDALINEIGIIDSKKYYRSLFMFDDKPYLLLNRETQLKSHKSLLEELKCLAREYQKRTGESFDFYNPPENFVSYINNAFRGKTAHVLLYPGPSVKKIEEITWKYRAGQTLPDGDESPIEYQERNYGIKRLDEKQPLVKYSFDKDGSRVVLYHIPEILVTQHTFKDLQKRISSWQRPQVWDYIHPDCKNQLREIFDQVRQIKAVLNSGMSLISPSRIDISEEPLDVSDAISEENEINISFGNKNIALKPPYYRNFYRLFNENIRFANTIKDEVSILAHSCVDNLEKEIDQFLSGLKEEYERRNDSHLRIEKGKIDFDSKNYLDFDLVLTIGAPDILYDQCKQVIQNEDGVLHQNVRSENISSNAVVALIMQITLMLGGDPWLLRETGDSLVTFGVYSYRNPFTGNRAYYYNAFDSRGKLLFQSKPFNANEISRFLENLLEKIKEYSRVLLLLSHDDQAVFQWVLSDMKNNTEIEFICFLVKDWSELRIFKSWTPQRQKRRRRAAERSPEYPVEAYPSSPQGAILKINPRIYYILTSRSVSRGDAFRGCPVPIKVEIIESRGVFDIEKLMRFLLSMSFMTRFSGHITRRPSPFHLLRKYAAYVEKHGYPSNEDIKQKMFYL